MRRLITSINIKKNYSFNKNLKKKLKTFQEYQLLIK